MKGILKQILSNKSAGKKALAILIDPDKAETAHLDLLIANSEEIGVSFFLVGGSLLNRGDLENTIQYVKSKSNIPLIIFPGSPSQISPSADGILFLSLLSSRNPEMLIGQQVIAAPYLKKTNLEIISTAYLLIDSGSPTTASYISNSNPIPANKSTIAASTALAGQFMGMDIAYLDGGSGAEQSMQIEMIEAVSNYIDIPLVLGGGFDSYEKVRNAYKSGADLIVIGNAAEENPSFLKELATLKDEFF